MKRKLKRNLTISRLASSEQQAETSLENTLSNNGLLKTIKKDDTLISTHKT